MRTIYKKLADLSTNLFKSKYVPFISEVEEFNDMMGKSYQNRTEPTIEPADAQFVINFIQEELDELKEAVIKAVWYGHDEKPEMIHVSEDFAEQYYNENHKPN